MNTLKTIASLIRSVPASLSAKAWLVIFCVILGIPTSIYGVHWFVFKFVKQEVDCHNNLYFDIANSNAVPPQQQSDVIAKAGQKHSECLKSVAPNKGTGEFLREQKERQKQGRP